MDGTDLILSVNGGALAFSTGCKITTSTETGERVTKEAAAGKWKEKYVKSFSESISADGVVCVDAAKDAPTYDTLKDLQIAGTAVDVTRYAKVTYVDEKVQELSDSLTYTLQEHTLSITHLEDKSHTHENQSALDQITAAKIAQWDGFGTQINGLSTKITVYSEKTERTLESLQKQIDNLTSGRNYTVLFQSGQNAILTYASNLSMILDGRYQTMADFLTAYPQFCSAANDFVLSYSQECFNWDKSVLTVCAKPLSLTKNAEIVMSYQSGSSEAGSLYLVPKPQKIDIPIGVYVNTEIDANRAVSLDFQWLQSDTFITTITECTGISDGEYYLAWVGRSNNSHPKIRFLKVLEG